MERIAASALVGDGQTDNSSGLLALRDTVRSAPDTPTVIEFPTGHYVYTDERWSSFGDREVILDFQGSQVECAARPFFPLGNGPIVWDLESGRGSTVVPGDLIESAAASDFAVLTAGADAYAPGDKVFIGGFIQQTSADGTRQFGWPPNFRFFEYGAVAAVDGQEVRLTAPLRFSYDAGWPDLPGGFGGVVLGAARIWRLRLDDGRQVNRELTIRNANFVAGRDRTEHTPLSPRGWHITIENCTTGPGTVVWPAEAKRLIYRGCNFGGESVELDKLVDTCRFESCTFTDPVTGGGACVLNATFEDCVFRNLVRLSPRFMKFNAACMFHSTLQLSKGVANTPFRLTGKAVKI